MNATNLPNELKYNDIVQGKDKEKWLQGMRNELGRLIQGFGDSKINNIFSSFQRTKHQKEM